MKRFFTLFGLAIIVFLTNTSIKAQSAIATASVSKTPVSKSEIADNIVVQSFDLAKSGNTIKINWQTSVEKNCNYFEIQRSFDGIHFDVIALMFAKEDAEKGAAYRYNDLAFTKIKSEKVFYRLRIIDMTGKSFIIDSKKISLEESIVPQ